MPFLICLILYHFMISFQGDRNPFPETIYPVLELNLASPYGFVDASNHKTVMSHLSSLQNSRILPICLLTYLQIYGLRDITLFREKEDGIPVCRHREFSNLVPSVTVGLHGLKGKTVKDADAGIDNRGAIFLFDIAMHPLFHICLVL